MAQRLNDKHADNRQHSGFNNSINKVWTTDSGDHLDAGSYEDDNNDCNHNNSIDTVSISIGLSSPVEGKQGMDHCTPSNSLYNRASSTSSKIPKMSGGGRKPRNTADRPVVRRSYNQGHNQQHRVEANQRFWRNNLHSAKVTATLATRWIVSLLNILLDTIKASAESRRLPSLTILDHLPVFQSVQGSYIRKPLHRQRCSPDNLMDEEEAIKRRSIPQTSIQEILDEIHLHRESYNKQVTPRILYSNPQNNIKNKKVMYVDLTSP